MSKQPQKSPASKADGHGQTEMFPDLPSIKLPKRVKSRWEELNELCDIVDAHGPILPCAVAAQLLNVSKQRVYQLIEQGLLIPVEFAGKKWLTEKQIRAFVELDRDSRMYVADWKQSQHFAAQTKS